MKKRFCTCLAMMILAVFSGCSNYSETQLGEVTVVKKSSTFRTEGGGVQEEAKWPGTSYLSGWTVDVETFSVDYAPVTLKIENFPVVMRKMKSQQQEFWLYLEVMPNPNKAAYIFANLPNWKEEILRIFRDTAFKRLSNLDVGYSEQEVSNDKRGEWESRAKVAQTLYAETVRNFNATYPKFQDCFWFIAADIGNDELNDAVMENYEKAAAEKYRTDVKRYERELNEIKNQKMIARSGIDLEAYSIEAGAMDQEVMNYLANDMVNNFMEDPNTETIVFLPVDKKGDITWFGEGFLK